MNDLRYFKQFKQVELQKRSIEFSVLAFTSHLRNNSP